VKKKKDSGNPDRTTTTTKIACAGEAGRKEGREGSPADLMSDLTARVAKIEEAMNTMISMQKKFDASSAAAGPRGSGTYKLSC
jgi:hypothetical protein